MNAKAAKGKRKTSTEAIAALDNCEANTPFEDGSLEDQINSAVLKATEAIIRLDNLEQKQNIAIRQNIALMDIFRIQGINVKMIDLAYQNVVIYEGRGDLHTHEESRLQSLKRLLERGGYL